MIDLSDGLAGDLRHILRASQVSAILDERRIPIHPDVDRFADLPREPIGYAAERLRHALSDGEDFELCFTLPAERAADLERDFVGKPVVPCRIGTIVEGASAEMRWLNGAIITAAGYEHDWR